MTTGTPKAPFAKETGEDGSFRRQQSRFRDWVTASGEYDPRIMPPQGELAEGTRTLRAEPGRFHLYVSLACPWAHRSIIYRALHGIDDDVLGMTIVDPIRDERGWRFVDEPPATPDPVNGWSFLAEGYHASDPAFEGRVTVPTLWDTVEGRVVSNESSEVIRMLDTAFDAWARHPEVELLPGDLRAEVERINEGVYRDVNNGVYKAGFATTQGAYEAAFDALFARLDELDSLLGERRYLAGDRITEADWRLFTTLVRFDAVYVGHFKCNLRRIVDYGNLWPYARELFQVPGVAATVDFDHIKRHYYCTHDTINPTGIVPKGPAVDWHEPHGRGA
jgi:putative glutathione S-transferase